MNRLRVLLLAEEGAGLQTLRLVAGSHHLVGVVSSTEPTGKPIRQAAEELGCRLWHPQAVKDEAFLKEVETLGIDLLLNVHSLVILPEALLTVPRIGAFNLHPGPLPGYPGLSVPSWAIYHGETSHAVTLHWMEAKVDAGDIVAEEWMDITPSDTGLSLSLKCIRQGLPLVERLLELAAVSPDEIPRRPQERAGRRFFRRGAPDGGMISWENDAESLLRLVRAADYRPFSSPWGAPWTVLPGGEKLGVLQATATDEPATERPGTVGEVTEAGAMVASGTDWICLTRVETEEGPRPPSEVLTKGMCMGANQQSNSLSESIK